MWTLLLMQKQWTKENTKFKRIVSHTQWHSSVDVFELKNKKIQLSNTRRWMSDISRNVFILHKITSWQKCVFKSVKNIYLFRFEIYLITLFMFIWCIFIHLINVMQRNTSFLKSLHQILRKMCLSEIRTGC